MGYTQKFKNQSLFLGVRNMNEDYFTVPFTSFFTIISCGIFPTISIYYTIATYPLSSLSIYFVYFCLLDLFLNNILNSDYANVKSTYFCTFSMPFHLYFHI